MHTTYPIDNNISKREVHFTYQFNKYIELFKIQFTHY